MNEWKARILGISKVMLYEIINLQLQGFGEEFSLKGLLHLKKHKMDLATYYTNYFPKEKTF